MSVSLVQSVDVAALLMTSKATATNDAIGGCHAIYLLHHTSSDPCTVACFWICRYSRLAVRVACLPVTSLDIAFRWLNFRGPNDQPNPQTETETKTFGLQTNLVFRLVISRRKPPYRHYRRPVSDGSSYATSRFYSRTVHIYEENAQCKISVWYIFYSKRTEIKNYSDINLIIKNRRY